MKRILAAVVPALALSVPALAADTDLRAAVEAGAAKFSAGVAKGDAAALAALYTSDAQAFPPGGERVDGRAAIQKMWADVLAGGIGEAKLAVMEVVAHGDSGHETGTYVLKDKAGKVVDRGKYVVVWKQEQGQWKLHRDIWNSSVPPGGTP